MKSLVKFLEENYILIDSKTNSQHYDVSNTQPLAQAKFTTSEELLKHNLVAGLTNLGLIKVSGEDAFSFLNNQISNDLALVTDEESIEAIYCNPKGLVLANFIILKKANSYWLVCHLSLIDYVLNRLKMFVFRSNVRLEAITDHFLIGYSPNSSSDSFVPRKQNSNSNTLYTTHKNDLTFVQMTGIRASFLILGTEIPKKLLAKNHVVTDHQWNVINILEGRPSIDNANSEKHVAQMLNYDLINHINFKKGCFPGQEIIARLHYRGKATKRTVALNYKISQKFLKVEDIVLEYGGDRQVTAKVVNNIILGEVEFNYYTLVVVSLKVLENSEGMFKIVSIDKNLVPNEVSASVLELPYKLL